MKTATFPPLRVNPGFRQAAENVLVEDETLSAFVEQAVRLQVEHRQAQAAFVQRGLTSRDKALKSGQYVSADAVLDKLAQARQQARETNRKAKA